MKFLIALLVLISAAASAKFTSRKQDINKCFAITQTTAPANVISAACLTSIETVFTVQGSYLIVNGSVQGQDVVERHPVRPWQERGFVAWRTAGRDGRGCEERDQSTLKIELSSDGSFQGLTSEYEHAHDSCHTRNPTQINFTYHEITAD